MLTTIFFKLLENSLQANFFIFAILLVRLCFKRMQKRYICILWALLALRLICPVEITSPFSLVPDTDNVQTWAEAEIAPPQQTTSELTSPQHTASEEDLPQNNSTAVEPLLPNISQSSNPISDTSQMNSGLTDDITSTTLSDSADVNVPTVLNMPVLFSTIWCVGMVLLLSYGVVSYFYTKLQLREAVHDKENIWYCDSIPSPFVMGYVKPRIYIPFSVDKEQLPYIIAHEKSHIAHLDHLGKFLGYILLCMYWFNPFVWGAYISYCKDLELACDERVILQLGDSERKPYSEALLICSVTNKALLQSPLSFSEVAIKERIIHILNYKKPGFWGLLAAAVACVLAVVCFLTSPTQPASEDNTETTELFGTVDVLVHYADYVEMLEALADDFSSLRDDGKVFYSCPSSDFAYLTALNEVSSIQLYFYALKEDMNYVIGKSSLTLKRTDKGYDIYEQENVLLDNITSADDFADYPLIYGYSDLLAVIDAGRQELGSSDLPLRDLIRAHYCGDGRYANLGDDFSLFAPDTALEALLPLEGGTMEVFPDKDDNHKLVHYTFADGTQLTFTMETDGVDSSIGGKAFWFPENWIYKTPNTTLEAKKTEVFTLQATAEDLANAHEGFSDGTDYLYTLPDVFSPDLFCKVAETSDGTVTLYGLRNCNSLILQDGDNLYPIFMRWYLNRGILPEVYKSDYDSDGEYEYAIYSLENSGSETEIMRLTMLEVVDGNLVMEIFNNSDLAQQMHITTNDGSELTPGSFVYFEERSGQWWVSTSVCITTNGTTTHDYSFDILLQAPITYYDHHMYENRYFDIGDVDIVSRTPLVTEKYTQETLVTYADQLASFPGTCSVDENGYLWTKVAVTDYECAPATNSTTGEQVYHWSTRTPAKTYPLEIKNGTVQEIPARLISEDELLEYSYGEELLKTTYTMYPYGIKQYILRENGTLHVNIGYSTNNFLNLQYLAFQISPDQKTVSLSDYGKGYYLLQVNNITSLQAFRDAFCGPEHILPADSSHLPWTWLLALNGEPTDKPALQAEDVPQISHCFDFDSLPHQNLYNWYNGFVATELWLNDTYFTEFRYRDNVDDIVLLTDDTSKLISITVNEFQKTLPKQTIELYYGIGGSYGVPYYVDVTGDGIKELVFESGYRTSNECYVYDATSMKNYPFETDGSAIVPKITISLGQFMISETDSNICFEITNGDEKVTHEMSFNKTAEIYPGLIPAGLTPEGINEYFNCRLIPEIQYISYQPEKQCFEATLYIVVDHVIPNNISGVVHANYIWDDNSEMFVLDLDSVQLRAQ